MKRIASRANTSLMIWIALLFLAFASPPAARATEPAAASTGYMLGAGDVLSITVFGDAQLSTTAPIGPDGIISMPLVGQFLASGRTIAELKAEIETRLTTYIKNPDVTIIVTSFRPIRVAVLGAAARPGSYQLPQGSRAADAIAAAGGLADDADPAAINLALADAAVTLDYAALVSDLATNPTLTDGAVIFIPRATPRIATVLGAVARPGTYPLEPGTEPTLKEILAAAGGLARDADARRAMLTLADGTTQQVDLEALLATDAPDIALTHSATLFVPALTHSKVALVGEVARPGVYEIEPGTTLARAVALAGGLTDRAGDALVYGSADPSAHRFAGDPLSHLMIEDGDLVVVESAALQVTVLGKVARPGSYELRRGATALQALAAAGGLAPGADATCATLTRGGVSLTVNLDGLDLNSQQTTLTDGDVLYIPELEFRAIAMGQVARPGAYDLKPGAKLLDLIAVAGGTLDDASHVEIYSLTDSTTPRFEGLLSVNPALNPGDIVAVQPSTIRVTVLGEVARPGAYDLKPGAKLLELIAAAGGTVDDAAEFEIYSLTDSATPYFEGLLTVNHALNPGDTIIVKPNTVRVTVLGEVARPGTYELRDDAGLAQALAAAGGLTADADGASATLTRDGLTHTVNLAAPDFDSQLTPLSDGDVIYVPQLEFRVIALGQVARPGAYDLKPGAKLLDLIAAAGGTLDGADQVEIYALTDSTTPRFKGLLSGNPALNPGDTVVVQTNTIRVTVLGKVARPGTYELRNDAGLAQALAAAGGLTADADGSSATLTRQGGALTVNLTPLDPNSQPTPLADGDVIYVPELEFNVVVLGQVARPGAYDLKPGAKLLDLIAAAGGTVNGAEQVEIYSLTDSATPYFGGLLAVNPALNPGDTIIVKPNTVRVTVLGEVVRPDTYELHDDAGLAQALAAAGGLTAAADATAATLTRDGLRHTVNISVPDLNAQLSPLADGDVIYVPELEFRILALGQVARPGAYDLKPGAKLLDLISAAGGTLNGADEVEIYSADDSTDPYFEGLLSVNPTLNPGDTVIVKPNTVRVTVLGEVARPGTYELRKDAGLAQALAAAGGLTPDADGATATLTRDGDSLTVNLTATDLNAQLTYLADGDVISIPKREFRGLVMGQVARPGAYDLMPGAKLLDLISAAGGTLDGAGRVEIYALTDSATPYFEGLLSVNPALNPGDLVVVKPNTVRVTVLGQVARPGTFELREDAGLAQALAAAGGLTDRADGAAATLTRDGVSLSVNWTATDFNTQLTRLADGDLLYVPELQFSALVLGQVARPGAYDLKPGAKLMDLIAVAGGTLDGADQVEIYALTDSATPYFEGLLSVNPALNPGDTIIVKPNTVRVTVLGEVARPGTYELRKDAGLAQALAAAGGLTPDADSSAATLTRDGLSLSVNIAANDFTPELTKLADGDVLYIPELEFRGLALGKVARPGAYDLKPGARLVDLIAAAGGTVDGADEVEIYSADSSEPYFKGVLSVNPALKSGDMVLVKPSTVRVTVLGEVARPGLYELDKDGRLIDAIAMAGGLSDKASGHELVLFSEGISEKTQYVQFVDGAAEDTLATNPRLSDGDVVFVPESTDRNVLVLGEVARPGAYSLPRGARLLDAIAAAGGATSEASLDDVTISREGAEPAVVFSGRIVDNPPVNPGDVVQVGSRVIKVTVLGKAARPGTYELFKGARVIDAIAAAGGLASDADRRGILVAPADEPGAARSVDLDTALPYPVSAGILSDGDVVFVPELRQQLAVMGEVARPGVYAYNPGVTVLEALALAGGATAEADLSRVRLYRSGSASSADAIALDIGDDRLAFEGDVKSNPILMAGDILIVPSNLIRVQMAGHVARPGEVQLRSGATVLDAIAAAGGLSVAGDGTAVVITGRVDGQVHRTNVDELLSSGGSAPTLADGDIVFVPEANRKVAVMGAVARPGLYDHRQGMRLIEALAAAGGPTDKAKLDKVLVYSGEQALEVALGKADAKNLSLDPKGSNNPALNSGDIVIVPQSDKIDWSAIAAILSAASSLKNLLSW